VRILLVDSPFFDEQLRRQASRPFSLGLLAIHSHLVANGHADVQLENFGGSDWGAVEDRLRSARPDIIGASCLTDTRGFCWRLARLAKEINPKVSVVLGGYHPTYFAREILEHHPVDFCVVGEGEETMLELVRALDSGRMDFANILGLAYRDPKTGEARLNERRPLLPDLDAIPISLEHRLFTNEAGKRQANMISSRGCPFACGFCSSSSFWGRTWRKRRIDRIVEEFEALVALGAETIEMTDDLFTMDLARAERFCDTLIAHGNRTPWTARARTDRMTERLADRMIAARCKQLEFGVESGDPEVLRRVNKQTDPQEAIDVFAMLARKDIRTLANFMIGNPGESPVTVRRSIRLACRLNPDRIIIGLARAYPNTMLGHEAEARGIVRREFWYLESDKAPHYTGDMSLQQMQLLAAEMLVRWAVRRGLRLAPDTVRSCWRYIGGRQILSFAFSALKRRVFTRPVAISGDRRDGP